MAGIALPRFHFHHVGIGTTQFDAGIEGYQALGLTLLTRIDDPNLRVRVAFLGPADGAAPLVEILAPLGEGGPLDSFIRRKRLPSPYHVAFGVPDIGRQGAALIERGYLALAEPQAALAMNGARIQFLVHRAAGMVELVEQDAGGNIVLAGIG